MIRRSNSLLLVGLLTVIVHAVVLFIVIPQAGKRIPIFYSQDRFSDGYDQLAENLAHGNGYRFYPDTAKTLMREPGYPIFLAGLLTLFGNTFAAVKLSNMCLALATAWLMTRLIGRISSSRTLLIAAPLLFLFHPATLIAESRGGVEMLFTFLVVLFLVTLYAAMEHSRWWDYATAGAVLGLTVLVRSTPLLFPLFLLGFLLVSKHRSIAAFAICRNVAVMVVAMFAVLSPWIVRNYDLTGRFVPTASVLGVSAQAGEYICAHRFENKPWYLLDREAAQERSKIALALGYRFEDGYYYQSFYSTQDEMSFSAYLARQVFGNYARDPLLCAKCMALNVFNFWFEGKTWTTTIMNIVVQLPYLIFAVMGTLVCVKSGRWQTIGPLVLFILYVMAVHMPILAQARYSVPLIPLLSILGSFCFVTRAGSAKAMDVSSRLDTSDRDCSEVPVGSLIS
jgi:4-amino-4-deoxy-L-arabinose transferase-like glycosyltransferase